VSKFFLSPFLLFLLLVFNITNRDFAAVHSKFVTVKSHFKKVKQPSLKKGENISFLEKEWLYFQGCIFILLKWDSTARNFQSVENDMSYNS